ncbi:MAG: T9SS type A sorting domain-containing protein, partial [Bacteroidales bacterium]|nr:T9SS type A sorting domain-containing protein [Bacteroidales bacterium]
GQFSTAIGNNQELVINFDEPFIYQGGNLCIMTHREFVTANQYYNYIYWLVSDVNTNRTVRYYSDAAPFNFANPAASTGSWAFNTAISNVTINEIGIKEFTLDYTVTGEGEVNVVLTPDPLVCGQTGTVTINPANDCTEITAIKFNGVSQTIQTSYTFPNQNVPLPVITIETAVPHFNILASASGNGQILPNGLIEFICGEDQTYNFLPEIGYMVDYVEVDGVVLPKSMYDYYTFTNIIAPHTIHVSFKEAPLAIYFSFEGTGGKVIPVGKELQIPYGQIGVDYGDMQQFLFTPMPNYVLQAVYIDGVYNALATNTGSYFFFNIQTNHIVHAVFAPINFNIFATAGTGGLIDPAGNIPAPYGTTPTFTFIANTGYVIDRVFVDNKEVPVAPSYTFSPIDTNHTIHVTFKIAELVIHMNWNQGGTLYPTGNTYIPTGTYSGDVYVNYNSTQEITFTPQTGYKVSSLVVNGVSYPNFIPTGSYTFYYIKTDQTINVTFAKIQYEIVAKSDQHSAITPAGTTMIPHGNSMKYDFYAFNGYHLTNVFVDGIDYKPAVASGTYTFENVTKAHTIDVVAAINTYTISAKVIGVVGGYITPAGDTKVNWGANQLYTISTYPGYKVTSVLIDGVPNGEAVASGAYVFLNVTKDHTIEVSYELLRFNIVSTASDFGMIDPMGITELDYGTDVTFTITPDEGYKVSFVLVNGTNIGEITSYTFSNVDGDGTIDAFFAKMPNDPTDPGDPNIIKDPIAEVSIYNQENIVYIVNKKLIPLQDISIFDMYGRVVWQGNVYNDVNTITLNVANGVYTVRISTGDQYSTTKISIVR